MGINLTVKIVSLTIAPIIALIWNMITFIIRNQFARA